jgi:hypothetical protein
MALGRQQRQDTVGWIPQRLIQKMGCYGMGWGSKGLKWKRWGFEGFSGASCELVGGVTVGLVEVVSQRKKVSQQVRAGVERARTDGCVLRYPQE